MENELTTGEQIELLTTLIFNFAEMQFQSAGLPASLGRVVLDGVRARHLDIAYNEAINSKVPRDKPKTEEHISNAKDLVSDIQAFYNSKEVTGNGDSA